MVKSNIRGGKSMFCFSSGSAECECDICAIRTSGSGKNTSHRIPNVDIYKETLTISFGEKVIAKDFAKYFGVVQQRMLAPNFENEIVIDFTNTKYINHFCISKILITAYKIKQDKKVSILLPTDCKNNKMLRFLYNRGILDFIFLNENFQCFVGEERVTHYLEKYNFEECYDYAIYPYTIFEIKMTDVHSKEIENLVKRVLESIEKYFSKKNQSEKYQRIESRVKLYLFEIVDNIFEHAYKKGNTDKIVFAINIYNSYLPPYKVLVGTPEECKFENRIVRLQTEVPMSVYRDIHDRYFGGFNIFIDDIGDGIDGTYPASNLENKYKDVYINGSKKRKTINGLKLVADQMAINADLLWAHDGRSWVSTSFTENSNICRSDDSKTIHYEHPSIKGLTYDLFVNLAQNSKEKKKTYEQFGNKVSFKLDEVREIILGKKEDELDESIFVDLLNRKNRNKSFTDVLCKKYKYLFYRPRATQKNKMANEIDTRIISKFTTESHFDYLIVYDLNQTTLFQIKAVFENKDIAVELIQKGIKGILLFTEESWLFYMIVCGDSFSMRKIDKEKVDFDSQLLSIYKEIHENDKKAIQEIWCQEYSNYLFSGKIFWGFTEIEEYIDIEKMIIDRTISDLLCKSIARISGMLSSNQKLVFLEKFMEMKFGPLVNEYKNEAVQNIYFGSIIMSGETEKRVASDQDIKIYLFKHRECTLDLDDKHLILFELPVKKSSKKGSIRRRILNTNRTEECSDKSDEYKYYQEDAYIKNINKIEYMLGFYNTGFLSIPMNNDVLYEGYIQFILDIIKIKLRKFDVLSVQVLENLPKDKIKKGLENGIERILGDNEFRNFGKKVHIDRIDEVSSQLIIKVGKNFELLDLMTDINHSKNEVIYIPLFNNILFDSDFPKILDAGYLPYLPLYYDSTEPIINNVQLEKFYSFTRTLNPHYRKELEFSSQTKEVLKINTELTSDILNFYNHLMDDESYRFNVLPDIISRNVNISDKDMVNEDLKIGQYSIFVNALLLQHSIVRLNSVDRTKIINSILNFLVDKSDEIEDSIVTYLLLVIIKSVSYDNSMLGRLFDKELGKKLLKSKSNQLRILFADLFYENCRLKFETELDSFYVSSDIAIYYNMLAQLLFNSHGTIHDGKLDMICKKIIEHPENMKQSDIDDINSIIPNCISLLKLTRSYDQSMEIEENLEREFFSYTSDVWGNLQRIKDFIEKLKIYAQERFVFIDREAVENGIKNYVEKVKEVLVRKQYDINSEEISNLNVTIGEDCDADKDGHVQRNINLYKDTIIFEELAYLLHNAHSHSFNKFSLHGNGDKKYLVWIRAELHSNFILLRFFNSIEKKDGNYENIVKKIHEKKRVGKTYLEKFNIHVLYEHNPKGPKAENDSIDIFETRIEIPYFN